MRSCCQPSAVGVCSLVLGACPTSPAAHGAPPVVAHGALLVRAGCAHFFLAVPASSLLIYVTFDRDQTSVCGSALCTDDSSLCPVCGDCFYGVGCLLILLLHFHLQKFFLFLICCQFLVCLCVTLLLYLGDVFFWVALLFYF